MSARLTRRQLLARSGGALAGLAAAGGAAYGIVELLNGGADAHGAGIVRAVASSRSSHSGFVTAYRSEPRLRVPAVTQTGRHEQPLFLAPGSTVGEIHGPPPGAAQQGAMIVGGDGELVWFSPVRGGRWVTDVRVQTYRGDPVLTYWEGKVIEPGFGQGEGVILDRSYREIARVRAGNGRFTDLHEFQLTDRGTALITCYPPTVLGDLAPFGGPSEGGQIIDSIFQEVDIATGEVLLEWQGLDHVAVTESHQPYNEPYDYLHVNSLNVLPDGNLLVSARATWALYKVDRSSGEIIWRLGGTRSDFALGPGVRFSWQHDATPIADTRITLFDDGAGKVQTEPHSRGLVLDVDEDAHTVSLARAFSHPVKPVLATAMGSFQTLPDGDVVIGWGTTPYISTFSADGRPLTETTLRSPSLFTYRAYRSAWAATPTQPPALVTAAGPGDHTTLYASWNGATEVSAWRVHAGPTADQLAEIGHAPRRGFETAIEVRASGPWFAVTALDSAQRALATSRPARG